ncbi:hypothetical protein ACVR1I_02655 [Streptococcus cameli]
MAESRNCQECHQTDTIICKSTVYGAVTRADKKFPLKQELIYHEICKNCGTILRSYIKSPSRLL